MRFALRIQFIMSILTGKADPRSHSQSEALSECVCDCLSVQCNSQIPHVCAVATCERRFWSSSCTGISSRLSGFAGELEGWTGLRMHDCSGGMKRVSHLLNTKVMSVHNEVLLHHAMQHLTQLLATNCAKYLKAINA